MGTVTVTTAANLIPQLWSKRVNVALESKLVAGKRVLRLDEEVKMGSLLNIPSLANITATAVSAGGVTTRTANTEGETEVSINRHFATAVEVDDISKIQSSYDLFALYTGKLIYGIAIQVEDDVLGLYSGLSQQVGSSGVPVTDDGKLNAIQLLDESDSPEEDRSGIYRPASKRTLMQIDKFVDASKMGMVGQKGPVVTGLFGEIYGVPIFFDNRVVSSAGIHNLVFWKEFAVLAMQKDISVREITGTALALTKTLAANGIWGFSEHRDTSAVDFLS